MLAASLALLLLSAFGAAAQPAPYQWRLPTWLPAPLTPDFNPMSEAKADLGRHLFYDGRLSLDGTLACASCHQQEHAFTDGRTHPTGITGAVHPRNTMSLANVAYLPMLTWANPIFIRLEQQALLPLFGEAPVEMGMAGQEDELFARLSADPVYREKFAAAFPDRKGAIDLGTLVRALAAFQRGLISADSPYDRYRYGGQPDAIPAAAKRGEALFFSERLECFHCHGGLHFTDSIVHSAKPLAEIGFHNTGLYNLDGKGAFPAGNQGLYEFTLRPEDMGRFRTPSLRNVARTAPYMHDGSVTTLREVVAHYGAGGRTLEGTFAGIGADSPLKSPFLIGFQLSDAEIDDVLAFLESLTDETFLADPAFADPWPADHPARAGRR